MDAVGTNIRLDARGREVMRALPRLNEDVNEEWAHDKTRHAVDGLLRNRLDRPWLREGGKLRAGELGRGVRRRSPSVAKAAKGSVAAVAGDLRRRRDDVCGQGSCSAALGSDLLEGRQTGLAYDASNLAAVNFNSTIAGIETADAILLVGTNPRWEAPLVNTRIRKAVKAGREGVRDRAGGRPHLPGRVARRRSVAARRPARGGRRAFGRPQRPAVIVGGAALKVPGGQAASLALVEQPQPGPRRLERLQRPPHRRGADGRADARLSRSRAA